MEEKTTQANALDKEEYLLHFTLQIIEGFLVENLLKTAHLEVNLAPNGKQKLICL